MKKITLLILMSLFSMLGYSQAFSENFDATAAIPAGWTVTNNGLGAGQQWVYTGVATQVNSAPGAMRVLAQNTGGTQTFEDWLITPAINLATISNPELRFQAKTSLGNNQNSKIKVMVSTTNTALTSFTLVREWHEFYTGDPDPANAIGTANNVYALNTADLTAAAGGQANVYVAFVMENTGAGDNWFLDDVQIVQLCPNVTTPVAIPTGQTTAQLSWANPGAVPSFDIEIVALPGTPTGVPTYTAVTNNPFNVTTGLVAGAQYAFYVRSNCGGVTGTWTTATNFTMPINYCAGTHFYDSGGAGGDYANNANVTTLICPANPGDIVTVTFNTFNTESGWDFLRVYDGPNATFPLLGTYTGTAIPPAVTANIANGGCLTFVFTSDGSGVRAGWDATVTCSPPPTCPAPSALLVNSTTDTTANLQWTNGLSETAWEVVIQAPGAGAPTVATTGLAVGSNPYTATTTTALVPLTPATNYEYWVRAVCAASDKSVWIGPRTFTTLCSTINVPFQEGFNSTSPTQQCWTVLNVNGDTDAWNMDYATNPFEGNQAAMLLTDGNGGANNDWLISPVLNLSATPGPKRLKFHYRVQSATEPNDFRVVLSTTGTATANFTETLVPLASYNNTTYLEKIVNLVGPGNVPYTGNVNIAFHVPQGGLDGWRLYIDNVIVEDMPACPNPTNPVVNATTQTTATLSWTPGFTETAWEVVVQAPGAGVPTGASTIIPAGTNTNFVVNTGLNPSTNYEYWVRAYCNATDQSAWVGPIPFSTTQIPVPLNFTDNFEGPSGFTLVNGTQTNKWVIGTAVNNGGTSSLYVTNNGGTSNAYTNTANSVVHAYRDITVPAGVNLMNLSFDWRAVGESCCDYIRAWIVPTTYSPTAGTQVGGAAPAFLQLSPNLNQGAAFTTVSYDIPGANYTGQTIRLVFEWRNDGSAGTQPPGAIDNINFTIVTCPKPTALLVNTVGQDSATISWTAGGAETQWELVLQPQNAGVPTGASTIIPVTGTPSYTFPAGSLSPSTNYEYYVRAVCSPTDSSLWAGPRPFSTTQIPAPLNFTDNFEGPSGFTLVNGTQTNKWVIGTAVNNGGTSCLYVSNNNGTSNTYTDTVNSVVHAYRDIIVPPGVNLMNLSFDWRAVGESCCDYIRAWIVPLSYTPTAGTQVGGAAPAFLQLSPNLNQGAGFTTVSYDIPGANYTNQTIRLVFEWRNDGSVGTQPPGAIDNINFSVVSCPKPTALLVNSVFQDSATVSWTAGGTETQWELVLQPLNSGVPTGASTIIPVNGTPSYTFPPGSLSPNTNYEYYVRAICSPADSSLWAGPRPFTTTQIPAIVNFVEDFESAPTWTFNNGTQPNKWIVGTATSNGGAQSLYISNNNSANTYTNSSTSVVHAYRDILIPAGTNLMDLSFDWKAVGESCCDYLRVWTVPATFSPVAGTQITAAASNGQQLNVANMNQQSAWITQTYELTAGAYAGNIMRLVFEWRNDSSAGTNPPAAIDNINLTIPTCPEPYNLVSSGQSGSPIVTLTWTPGGSETQWEIIIQDQALNAPGPGATGIIVNGAPIYNFTGANGVFYEFYVRAICSSSDLSDWGGPTAFSIYAPPGCASVDVVGVGIDVVNNQVLLCPGQAAQDVELSASYFGIGATTSYAVSSIDYNPPFPFTGGTQVSVGTDDVWSPVVNLPFNFCFFGNSYATARVGSNGVVAFGIPAATTYCPWSFNTTIPNASFPILNAIYGVYQDVDPTINPVASGTTVNYQVLGSYPCRALVVNFANLNQYDCGTATGPQTSQVVLYEISNIIEVYVQRRVPCTSWQNGAGVIGIQNAAGTVAYTPSGRNTGAWSATNEAWRFTPNAPATINLEWIQNGVVIGTNNTVTVSVSDDTVVTAQATYTQCDGSTVVKTSDIQIVVTEELPTLEPHNMFACSNLTSPTFDLTQNGDYVLSQSIAGNYVVTYYTSEAAAIAAVPGTEIPNPTTYTGTNGEIIWMNITSNADCSIVKSFALSFSTTVPDYTLAGITTGSVTICNNDSATITVTPNNFDGTTAFYEWVDPTGAVIAETSGVLTLPAGALPGTYQVTVDTGCKSTQTFNVSVVQITGTVNAPVADCTSSVATLVVTPAGGTTYEYSFDGGLTFQNDNTYTNLPGTYPIIIRDTTTGCESVVFDGVIVENPNAPVQPTLAAPVDQTCSANGEIHVTGPTNGPVNYANLFISEVTDSDGGSLSYVEIYNGTGAAVNLSNYKLKFYTTLGAPSCNFALVGMLANGATHIVKVSNDANIPGVVPNQSVTTCTGVNFNDRIHLTTSTGAESIIDVWGTPDGSTFTPAGQPGYTYRRINTAPIPSSTWNAADWNALDPEDYTNLGSYVPANTNYFYSLDGGTPQASPDFTNVAPGNHVVTVVDMTTGCISPGTAITIGAAQQPEIAYASPFCQGAGTVNPTVQTGEINGVYSSTAGLTIDPTTGAIDLNASTAGMYTVTYAITGSVNCTPATFNIVINANTTPVTGFTYTTPVCILSGGTLLPTGIAGFTAGGQFSAPTGLSINSTTGAIDVANSTAGTYIVTYAVAANLCNPSNSSVFNVTIDPATIPVVDFSYTDICTGGANQLPTLAAGFTTGGTFSSTTGLAIDPVTGEINVAGSTSGTYTVSYHVDQDASVCQAEGDQTATITIIAGADIAFEQGCEGVNYMITAVPVDGSFNPSQVSYAWTGPNGFTATTQSVVATTMGSYTVVITTLNGCTTTITESITPESCLIPKGISPNNDGSNDNFDLEGMNVRHLSIINRYGATVYEHGAGYTNQWYGQSKSGNELPDGTYYYVIESGDGQTRTGWVYINRQR